MEQEGGGKGHPLLYLHRSHAVLSENKKGSRSQSLSEEAAEDAEFRDRRSRKPNGIRSKSTEIPSVDPESTQKPIHVMLFKTIIATTLLVLWLLSVYSNFQIGAPQSQAGIISFVRDWNERAQSFLSPFLARSDLIAEQLGQRVGAGRDMLRNFEDAAGSVAVCESALQSVLEKAGGAPRSPQALRQRVLSAISSSTARNPAEETLICEALICLGEAKLALFSSSYISSGLKGAQLEEAKDSFEAAIAVDPTNLSVRGGLGLSYLLLGMNRDSGTDNSLQYVYQSIQHLTAVVRVTEKDAERRDGNGESATIRTAAMHNLHLAHITLDGLRESQEAQTAFHSELRSPDESRVHLANEGASLLQRGEIEDALSSLESTDLVCSNAESLSRRQSETCSIAKRNLAVAREALYGEPQEQRIQSGDGTSIYELSQDTSLSSLDSGAINTEKATGEKAEFMQDADTVPETNPRATTEEMSSDTGRKRKEDDLVFPSTPIGSHDTKAVLAALEKAAVEGPHHTRRLLVLARARVSAGDFAGAADAAYRASTASTSEEEYETSTSYLETLIKDMEGREKTTPIPDKSASERAKEESEFVERSDLLQLELEVERLRYRVLEQEVMLGHRHRPANYEGGGLRAIEYRNDPDRSTQDAPRSPNFDAENVIASDIVREATEVEATAPGPVPLETETHVASNRVDNDTVTENHEATHTNTELLANEADTTDVDSDKNHTADAENGSDADPVMVEEEAPTVEPVAPLVLPSLFEPTLTPPTKISPSAKSYMKIADAYLDKGNYALASKQFRKTIKKAPDHLPAHLGYATAVEREDKIKQKNTAALAYGNATKVAIIQGEKAIAENIMKRAVQIAKSAPGGRLETLKVLSTIAHTSTLAADIHFEIGVEISKQGLEHGDNKNMATEAFSIANEFVASQNVTDRPLHLRSMIELGRISLEHERNGTKVIEIFDKVNKMHMEKDVQAELLVLAGRAYLLLGEIESARRKLTEALSLPQCASTPSAHHEFALASKNKEDAREMKLHFEKALDLGMDPTPEAIEALGERNSSVIRALNRQYYNNFNSGGTGRSGGGGIMSGGGVGSQSTSVFAPHAKPNEEGSAQSETLTLLEQGAASYDGQIPMGGEVEGTESSLSHLKAKKQQGSESNLSNLRR